jgi:hypothetical protein
LQDLSDDIEHAWRREHENEQMSDDLRRLECLRRLELELRGSNNSLRDFSGMPSIDDDQFRDVLAQFAHNVDVDEHSNKVKMLNKEQRAAFDRFVAALEHRRQLIINLDAPGGTGQLPLFRASTQGVHLRRQNVSAECDAGAYATQWSSRNRRRIVRSGRTPSSRR